MSNRKYEYYVPLLSCDEGIRLEAPLYFLLVVSRNTIKHNATGYFFYVDGVEYSNIEFVEKFSNEIV